MISIFKNKVLIFYFPASLMVMIAIYFSLSEINREPDKSYSASMELNQMNEGNLIYPEVNGEDSQLDLNVLVDYQSSESRFYIYSLLINWRKLFNTFTGENSLSGPVVIRQDENEEYQSRKFVRKGFSPGNVFKVVEEYGDLIVRECDYYKFDWRLILAIIKQESAFMDSAVSHAGAFGFMQIMPGTGAGLQRELKLSDTRTPANNLIAGIYYYATLVASFEFLGEDKYKFALAAYNAGLGRVIDAMTITAYVGGNYKKWDDVKESYPLLASSQDSIHSLVWPGTGRPIYGTLDNWREPYFYVEKIMYYWDEYKKIFESNI